MKGCKNEKSLGLKVNSRKYILHIIPSGDATYTGGTDRDRLFKRLDESPIVGKQSREDPAISTTGYDL